MKRVIEATRTDIFNYRKFLDEHKPASFVKQLCQSYLKKKRKEKKREIMGGERRGEDKDALSRGHRIINILVG